MRLNALSASLSPALSPALGFGQLKAPTRAKAKEVQPQPAAQPNAETGDVVSIKLSMPKPDYYTSQNGKLVGKFYRSDASVEPPPEIQAIYDATPPGRTTREIHGPGFHFHGHNGSYRSALTKGAPLIRVDGGDTEEGQKVASA